MRANQRILREVADNLRMLVFMASADGERFLYLSRGVEGIFGYSQEEAYAISTGPGWRTVVPPEDQHLVHEALLGAARTRGETTATTRIIRKDGGIRHLRVRVSAVTDADGEVAYLVGAAEDITSEVETRLAMASIKMNLDAVVEACAVAVISMDIEGAVQLWNPAAERLFGWKSEEVIGRPNPVVPPAQTEHLHSLHVGIREGRQMRGLIVPAVRKDGTRLTIRLAISPIRDATGQVHAFLGIVQELRDGVEDEPDSYSVRQAARLIKPPREP